MRKIVVEIKLSIPLDGFSVDLVREAFVPINKFVSGQALAVATSVEEYASSAWAAGLPKSANILYNNGCSSSVLIKEVEEK